jgi:hypothetical protein
MDSGTGFGDQIEAYVPGDVASDRHHLHPSNTLALRHPVDDINGVFSQQQCASLCFMPSPVAFACILHVTDQLSVRMNFPACFMLQEHADAKEFVP